MSPRLRTSNEGYLTNLRKHVNNTELLTTDSASKNSNFFSPQLNTVNTDHKFMRAVEEGIELNQNKLELISQKKNQRRNLLFSKYDYNTPGSFELAYRVADNLVGNNLKNANLIT